MRKKRIISALLCLLVLSCTTMSAYAASANLELYVPHEPAREGESFSVTVGISENPGFAALQLTLTYDKDVLRCTEVKTGELLKKMLVSSNTLTGDSNPGASVTAVGLDLAEGDGVLAEFCFTVLAEGETRFELSDIELADIDGEDILYALKRHTYKDTPPKTDGNTGALTAALPEQPLRTSTPFKDVPAGHWAAEYIARAVDKELIYGYEDGSFRPDEPITRAQFVSVLWRAAGCPEPGEVYSFFDVPADAWYAKQVAWAAENGYVSGVGGGKFAPEGYVTREQAMTILFRRNGGISGMETFLGGEYDARYADSENISEWAKQGVYWAVYNGVISGVTDSALAPKNTASRAQIVTVLLRYTDTFGITA